MSFNDEQRTVRIGDGDYLSYPRNPRHFTITDPNSLFSKNWATWDDALAALDLAAITDYPVTGVYGGELPGVRAVLLDRPMQESGQLQTLSRLCVNNVKGLGVHMRAGYREHMDRLSPIPLPGVEPRLLNEQEILADMAKVTTLGGEVRHPGIPPETLNPLLDRCRHLGTIGLLEQARM